MRYVIVTPNLNSLEKVLKYSMLLTKYRLIWPCLWERLKQIFIGVVIISVVRSLVRLLNHLTMVRWVARKKYVTERNWNLIGSHKSMGKNQAYVEVSANILDRIRLTFEISKQLLAKILLFVYETGSSQKKRRHCNVYVIHFESLDKSPVLLRDCCPYQNFN